MSKKQYRAWAPHEEYLLPPKVSDWLPEEHLSRFVLELVEGLDLSSIEKELHGRDPRGTRPYHPRMMVALLVYAYCVGLYSSRKIARATYENVAFVFLTGGQHPHFTRIAGFRRKYREVLHEVFTQILELCMQAGLVSLGHVAFDGSKIQANASKHKAMSYGRMTKAQDRLHKELRELRQKAQALACQLMERAKSVDVEEDARYGPTDLPTDLPAEIARRETRLARIEQARAELEAEARASRVLTLQEQAAYHHHTALTDADPSMRKRAATNAQKRELEIERLVAMSRVDDDAESEQGDEPEDESGSGGGESGSGSGESGSGSNAVNSCATWPEHQVPATPEGAPKPKSQRNFTDPDSRIMKAKGAYLQGYNCQTAVDSVAQVIVSNGVSNVAGDTRHLVTMLERTRSNCNRLPDNVSADSGYWSPENAAACEAMGVDAYLAVSPERKRISQASPADEAGSGPQATPENDKDGLNGVRGPASKERSAPPEQQMRAKVASKQGKEIYRRRKCIVEPPFGQIKEARGFRRFSMRGLHNARAEWSLVCAVHNLLKLYTHQQAV